MRVAFNATPLLSPLTGIGNYIAELGAALRSLGDIDAYSYYRYRWRHEAPTPPVDFAGSALAIVESAKRWVPFRSVARTMAHRIGFARGLRRNGIEIYHEQNYVPLAYDVPVVITVHDLSWLRYPETHPIDRVKWLERGLPGAIERAAGILVDSDFIRKEVLETFGASSERVHTAHLGVSPGFRPRDPGDTRATLAGLGLSHGSYVLTVGTIEPRKNVSHVLDAYALLPAPMRERFPLVVSGARGWTDAALRSQLRELSRAGNIRFLGHVNKGVLRDLYAGAGLFVFPSLYEGFGLPPLEAMASGAPVLCSTRASLPEITGDAAYPLDPQDPEATAATMRRVLEDESGRCAMAERGIVRAEQFKWTTCAIRTRNVYGIALGNPSA